EYVYLHSTQVSDASLTNLKACKNLTMLYLQRTKVTAAMIEELKTAIPRCRIEWDGGVIEPKVPSDSDRKAAEWVLSIGGVVRVNGQDRDIKAAADLPKEPFRLTLVLLHENRQVTDAGLANLKGCGSLVYLDLPGTQVTDAGLAHLGGCK